MGPFRVLGRDCRPSAGRTLCRCYSRSSQSVVAVLGAQMRSQDSRRDGAWRVAKHVARLGMGTASCKKTTDFAGSYFGRLTFRTYAGIAKSVAQLRLKFERFLVCGGASAAPSLLGDAGGMRLSGGHQLRYGKRKLNDCCLSLTPHCLTEPLCLMQLLELLNPSSLCQSPSNKCDSQVMGSEPFRPQFQNIESAVRSLLVLTSAIGKRVGLDFTTDLFPLLSSTETQRVRTSSSADSRSPLRGCEGLGSTDLLSLKSSLSDVFLCAPWVLQKQPRSLVRWDSAVGPSRSGHCAYPLESSTWSLVFKSLGAPFMAIAKNHSASEFTGVFTRDNNSM